MKVKSHDAEVTPHEKVELPSPRTNGDEAGVNGFTLPSLDASQDRKPSGQVLPPSHETAGDRGDSDSSNWSSSDEEEGEGGIVGEMRPSTHSTLIAEWEWRAMNQDAPASR